MKTWKLVSGILSIVLSLLVLLQSCAAGLSNAMTDNGESSGSAGALVAIILLVGGIISIATRKGSKGGSIATTILYGLGTITGFSLAGSYSDLKIWASWCLICAILSVVAIITKPKKVADNTEK